MKDRNDEVLVEIPADAREVIRNSRPSWDYLGREIGYPSSDGLRHAIYRGNRIPQKFAVALASKFNLDSSKWVQKTRRQVYIEGAAKRIAKTVEIEKPETNPKEENMSASMKPHVHENLPSPRLSKAEPSVLENQLKKEDENPLVEAAHKAIDDLARLARASDKYRELVACFSQGALTHVMAVSTLQQIVSDAKRWRQLRQDLVSS